MSKEEIKEYNVMLNNEQVKVLVDELKEKDREIERLNKCIKDDEENANEIMAEQQQEIERLNNIINELEIDSISGYYKPKSDDSDYLEGYDDGARLTANFFHNQIKKLRGE